MRRFLPALAALLLLLTLYACGKPSEEPTPSPAPPTEEPTTQTLTVTPSGSKGQRLVFRCPVDWEYYGYSGIDYQGQKLVETNYSPAEEKRTYLQKMEDIRIKQLGEREFYTYSEEYGILEGPEMTPGVEEKKVYLYTIWNYYFFDGEDCYRIALFENQEREQVISIPDFEDILANLEVKKPLENIETKKLAVTVNPDGEKQRLILECPADWEAEYGCITCEGRLLVDFYAGEAEYVKSIWQPDKTKDHDIWGHQIGEREFLISGEEYAVSGESNANLSPYQSLSYYFAEDGIGYLIRLEQGKEQVISIPDFEDILAGLEIEKPLGTTENAVGYEKMELGGFSLWLPEGTTCEDGSLRNERAGTEFLATVHSVESITDKAAPFAAYDETYSDSYRVEEHEFGGYAAKSYHRSWEEPDDALPMKMHEVIYCIDTGDEMIRLTLTPLIGLGVGTQCEMFEKILNSIEVG